MWLVKETRKALSEFKWNLAFKRSGRQQKKIQHHLKMHSVQEEMPGKMLRKFIAPYWFN